MDENRQRGIAGILKVRIRYHDYAGKIESCVYDNECVL